MKTKSLLYLPMMVLMFSTMLCYQANAQLVEVISQNTCENANASEVHVVNENTGTLLSDGFPDGDFNFILSNADGSYTDFSNDGIFTGIPDGTGYFVIIHSNINNTQYQCPNLVDILTDNSPVIEVDLLTDPQCPGDSVVYSVSLVCGGTPPFTFLVDTESGLLTSPNGIFYDINGGYFSVIDSEGTTSNTVVMDSPFPFVPLSLSEPVVQEGCDSLQQSTVSTVATGGDGNYTYYAINAADGVSIQNTSGVFNLEAGSYYIGVSDGSGCNHQCPQLVVVGTCCDDFEVNVSTIVCPSNAIGGLTGGTATFSVGNSASFSIVGPAGTLVSTQGESVSYMDLSAGTYNYTATDENGCSEDGSFIIDQADDYTLTVLDFAYDCTTGLIDATVELGGYNPDGGGYFTMAYGTVDPVFVIEDLMPGQEISTMICPSITLEACPGTVGFTVPDSIPSFEVGVETEMCPSNSSNASQLGTITLSFPDGTSYYTVTDGVNSWTNAASTIFDNDIVIEDLPEGLYTFTITNDTGCSQTIDVQLVTPDDYTLTVLDFAYNCTTGLVDATVELGGYNPDGGGYFTLSYGTVDPVFVIEDLTPGEVISTMICPSVALEACPGTVGFTVPDSFSDFGVEVETEMCPSNSNNADQGGTITVTITDGTAPFTMTDGTDIWTSNSWSNGANSYIVAQGMDEGFYSFIITDANGCTQSVDVQLQAPDDYTLTVLEYAYDCTTGLVNATIELGGYNPDGGGYYLWGYGSVDPVFVIDGLTPGEVISTTMCPDITLEACPGTVGFTVPDSLSGFEVEAETEICPSNANNSNGAGNIILSIAGGTAPFIITDGTSGTVAMITEDYYVVEDLMEGTYTYSITDATGCSQTVDVLLEAPEDYSLTVLDFTYDCQTGLVDATVELGGYNPDGGGYFTMAYGTVDPVFVIEGLTPGQVVSTMICPSIALEACPGTVGFVVPDSFSGFEVEVETEICPSNSTNSTNGGSIILSITGGVAPYIVVDGVTGSTTTVIGDFHVIDGLSEGTYTYSITDATGCTQTVDVVLETPEDYSLTVLDFTYDCSTGLVDATVELGGYNPDGGGYFTMAYGSVDPVFVIEGLTPGQEVSTVICPSIALEACPGIVGFTVPDSMGPFNVTVTTDACPSNSINFAGGTIVLSFDGTGPYYVTSDSGLTGTSLQGEDLVWNNVPEGIVEIYVSDDNGCIQSVMATVDYPEDYAMLISATEVDCATGLVNVTVDISGYNPDGDGYYLMGVGYVDTPYTFEGLNPGEEYNFTICPSLTLEQCPGNVSFTVPVDSTASSNILVNAEVTCDAGNTGVMNYGTIILDIQGGQLPYVIIHENANEIITSTQVTVVFDQLDDGVHTFTVMDNNGCSVILDVQVSCPNLFQIPANIGPFRDPRNIFLFPNPVSIPQRVVNVEYNMEWDASIAVNGGNLLVITELSTGRIIERIVLEKSKGIETIDISEYHPGTYIATLRSNHENLKQASQVFIVHDR